jgi:hypothetical protein
MNRRIIAGVGLYVNIPKLSKIAIRHFLAAPIFLGRLICDGKIRGRTC